MEKSLEDYINEEREHNRNKRYKFKPYKRFNKFRKIKDVNYEKKGDEFVESKVFTSKPEIAIKDNQESKTSSKDELIGFHLVVSNLSDNTNNDDIYKLFNKIGSLKSCGIRWTDLGKTTVMKSTGNS